MANKSKVKQITLHFVGDNTSIIDYFAKRAKANFRTVEQEIMFELNGSIDVLDSHTPLYPSEEVKCDDEIEQIIADVKNQEVA